MKRKKWKIVVMIVLIVLTASLISIWLSYNWLTVSNFTVKSSQIKQPFRIVLLSDLHNHEFNDGNKRLIEKVKEQSPNLIILDGDMINRDSKNASVAVDLIKSLKGIAPVYYSLGNHEIDYIKKTGHSDLIQTLETAGTTVLNNRILDIKIKGNSIRLGGLYEYGFETSMQSDEENKRAISYLEKYTDTQNYMIMCAHRPDSFYSWNMADKWGIDLVLSGHLHGGQVIIPGIGGLYSQLEKFFPKYDYGQYKLEKSDMIITRGLSSNPKILPRFNNPPEIAVVDVKPDKDK